jgi:hypothetical protein
MINDIKRHDDDNLGGNNSYIFIPEDDVLTIPTVFEGAIHTEIILKPLKKWFFGYGTEGTLRFTDVESENDHGTFYLKKFMCNVPKNRAELVAIFNKMKNRKFILLLTDNNGEKILVGTKEEPLSFKNRFDSKDDVPGRNEHEVEFYGEGVDKSPIFKGLCPLKGY